MSQSLLPCVQNKFYYDDGSNRPLSMGFISFKIAGSSINAPTFAANDGALNPNPVPLDINGTAKIWLDSNFVYDIFGFDPEMNPVFSELKIASATFTAEDLTRKLDKIQTEAQSVVSPVDFDGGILVGSGYFGPSSPNIAFDASGFSYIIDSPGISLAIQKIYDNNASGTLAMSKATSVDGVVSLSSQGTGATSSIFNLFSGSATTPTYQEFKIENLEGGGVGSFLFDGSGLDITNANLDGSSIKLPDGTWIRPQTENAPLYLTNGLNPSDIYSGVQMTQAQLKINGGDGANNLGYLRIVDGQIELQVNDLGIPKDAIVLGNGNIELITADNRIQVANNFINIGQIGKTELTLGNTEILMLTNANSMSLSETNGLKIDIPSKGASKVLTSDVDGFATWEDSIASSLGLQEVTDVNSVTTNGATFGDKVEGTTLELSGNCIAQRFSNLGKGNTTRNVITRNSGNNNLYILNEGAGSYAIMSDGIDNSAIIEFKHDGDIETIGNLEPEGRIIQGGVADDGNTGIQGESLRIEGTGDFEDIVTIKAPDLGTQEPFVLEQFNTSSTGGIKIVTKGDGFHGWNVLRDDGSRRTAFQSRPDGDIGQFELKLYDTNGSNEQIAFRTRYSEYFETDLLLKANDRIIQGSATDDNTTGIIGESLRVEGAGNFGDSVTAKNLLSLADSYGYGNFTGNQNITLGESTPGSVNSNLYHSFDMRVQGNGAGSAAWQLIANKRDGTSQSSIEELLLSFDSTTAQFQGSVTADSFSTPNNVDASGLRLTDGYLGVGTPQLFFGSGTDSYIIDDGKITINKTQVSGVSGNLNLANGDDSSISISDGSLSSGLNVSLNVSKPKFSLVAVNNTGSNSRSEIEGFSGDASTVGKLEFVIENALGGGVEAFNFVGAPIRNPSFTTAQKNALANLTGGEQVFDSTLGKMCFYNGTAWETITSS